MKKLYRAFIIAKHTCIYEVEAENEQEALAIAKDKSKRGTWSEIDITGKENEGDKVIGPLPPKNESSFDVFPNRQ